MKVVILAGGLGTRLSEETTLRPKPMVEIGGKPILWHIMKMYSAYGINDFIVCLGYMGYVIKEYFANYFLHNSDVTFDIEKNNMIVHQKRSEPWKITLVDTGENSGTGGRLRRIRDYLDNEDFCFTYGDGVSDVNIDSLIERHQQEGTLATLTAIQPESKYGVLTFNENRIVKFREKPSNGGSWINGGFFVLSPKVIDYIESDETHFEHSPLKRLAEDGELSAMFHKGFWQCMDTLRDKNYLETIWNAGEAPWKCWK
jgi:glucose-1-phosphate cytidylyltransferase